MDKQMIARNWLLYKFTKLLAIIAFFLTFNIAYTDPMLWWYVAVLTGVYLEALRGQRLQEDFARLAQFDIVLYIQEENEKSNENGKDD